MKVKLVKWPKTIYNLLKTIQAIIQIRIRFKAMKGSTLLLAAQRMPSGKLCSRIYSLTKILNLRVKIYKIIRVIILKMMSRFWFNASKLRMMKIWGNLKNISIKMFFNRKLNPERTSGQQIIRLTKNFDTSKPTLKAFLHWFIQITTKKIAYHKMNYNKMILNINWITSKSTIRRLNKAQTQIKIKIALWQNTEISSSNQPNKDKAYWLKSKTLRFNWKLRRVMGTSTENKLQH